MATDLPVALDAPRSSSSGRRIGIAAAVALTLLALIETAQALIAPSRAPREADWRAAAARLRTDFRLGDLIVSAPAWADPVMRMHVGDLLPMAAAARLDDARFGRVWEFSQRGARAAESAGRQVVFEQRFGAVTLRRAEKPAAEVTFDFLEQWQQAHVSRWDPASRSSQVCPWQHDRFACPQAGHGVQRALVEVDNTIRRALLAPPAAGVVVAVDFPSVTLGRELVVAVGLHDTWARKSPGEVHFEVWLAGQPASATIVGNRSGWHRLRIDTSPRNGQVASVRFQISSPTPQARHLVFAAEARR